MKNNQKKITVKEYNKKMNKIFSSKLPVPEILIKAIEEASKYKIVPDYEIVKSHKKGKVRIIDKVKLNSISLCKKCFCMTKTIKGKCGKCKEKK